MRPGCASAGRLRPAGASPPDGRRLLSPPATTSRPSAAAVFRRRPFPVRVDGALALLPSLPVFLTFSNSKFTGGTMMIAPKAEVDDGLIEYVRWGPIGRVGLIQLRTLYNGTRINHPLAERRPAQRIDFELDTPVDVMVDGEVLTLRCQSLDVLPSALNVVV